MDTQPKALNVLQDKSVAVMMQAQLGIPTRKLFAPEVIVIVHAQVIKTSVIELRGVMILRSTHVKQLLEHSVTDLLIHQHTLTRTGEV